MPEDEGTLALDNVITHDDRAIFMMDQISRAARKAFDDRAQPLSLNRTQWRVLAQLIRAPALNQTDIARRLEITSSSSGLEDMTPSRLSDRTRLAQVIAIFGRHGRGGITPVLGLGRSQTKTHSTRPDAPLVAIAPGDEPRSCSIADNRMEHAGRELSLHRPSAGRTNRWRRVRWKLTQTSP